MAKAVEIDPLNALSNAFFGEYLISREKFYVALDYLATAIELDPNIGLAYLGQSQLFLLIGMEESAKKPSILLPVWISPLLLNYVDRAGIHAFFGEVDFAVGDLDEAIRINPNQAEFYEIRARLIASKEQ